VIAKKMTRRISEKQAPHSKDCETSTMCLILNVFKDVLYYLPNFGYFLQGA